MGHIKIGVIVGSLRAESINRRLATAITQLASPEFDFQFIEIGALPLYSEALDASLPQACRDFKQAVECCDALLFVTPEYNRSIPGVLKNALDIGSRPWGSNSFNAKPGAVVGASIGAIGSALAQQHLRNVLSYLNVPLLSQPEIYVHFNESLIDAKGQIVNEKTRQFLQGFTDQYSAWVRRMLA